MFRSKGHYQQHATKLWKITRNCKGMYWWFIQPTIGQNCVEIRFMKRPQRETQKPSIDAGREEKKTYHPSAELHRRVLFLHPGRHLLQRPPYIGRWDKYV
jgi:hypothetical protein